MVRIGFTEVGLIPFTGKTLMSANQSPREKQSWPKKFSTAWMGLVHAVREHNSFHVHLPVAALVIGSGFYLKIGLVELCVLLMCVSAVLAAELFNTSIEYLARAISQEENEQIRLALDVASSAVLLVGLFAALVGGIVLAGALGV
jgi:diacylglycerol kinase